VREEVASREDMAKAELSPQRLHAMPRFLAALDIRRRLVNFDLEVVVRIALEPIEAVSRDLVLVVDLGDGGADVVRVKLLVGRDVVEHDEMAVEDGSRRRVGLGIGNVGVGGGVEDGPDVVVVAVRVQCDLLLCGRGSWSAPRTEYAEKEGAAQLTFAAAWVHVRMRVQVSSLGVEVTESDVGADHDICEGVNRESAIRSLSPTARSRAVLKLLHFSSSKDPLLTCKRILHAVTGERVLELARHEAVALAAVVEDGKVDGEHAHVEEDGDSDEADGASGEMPGEERYGHSKIAEQAPELDDGQDSHCRDGEEAGPLAADDCSKSETSEGEPRPPATAEWTDSACTVTSDLVLVGEADPEEGRQSGEEDDGRVEEDEAGLGDETVLKGDEEGAEEGGGRSGLKSSEGEVSKGDQEKAERGREHAHSDIRDVVGGVFTTCRRVVSKRSFRFPPSFASTHQCP
jgi:hypothetical protein